MNNARIEAATKAIYNETDPDSYNSDGWVMEICKKEAEVALRAADEADNERGIRRLRVGNSVDDFADERERLAEVIIELRNGGLKMIDERLNMTELMAHYILLAGFRLVRNVNTEA